MGFEVEETYISCGCNQTRHAADWGAKGEICFATNHAVAVFKPSKGADESSKIEKVFFSHKDRVKAVRWIRDHLQTPVDAFLSCSVDKRVVLTSRPVGGSEFSVEAVLVGHKDSVQIADGLLLGETNYYIPHKSEIIVATASVDSTVKLWTRVDNQSVDLDAESRLTCQETIDFNSGLVHDVRLALVGSSLLLVCATDDSKVHLFAEGQDHRWSRVHVLTGHEDWVTAMDFRWHCDKLYLATGSQDSYVRVYRMSVKQGDDEPPNVMETVPNFVETEETEFSVGRSRVGIRLDTVLWGHESWVYGVAFHSSSHTEGELRLVTSSMDRSMVIWIERDGQWIESARVGEVGGNTLGFYGGKFSPDGKSIMGHGYQGAFHIWRVNQEEFWEPQVVAGGHVGPVKDLCWSPSGRYLLSVGFDQTTRLHAPWVRDGKSTWHEIARPQVHGHNMSCIAALSDTAFASGAEEKVLRMFRAPTNFLENFRRICKMEASDLIQNEAPVGAAVPALGLSNKPVFQNTTNDVGQRDPETYFSPLHLDKPPTEEDLIQNTLWPEVQKLYGHGYEVHCVAASPDGAVIASACHATNEEHASVIIWTPLPREGTTTPWEKAQTLSFHRLTVTQMAFSPNGRHLVTVSRDRRWCLYRKDESSGGFVTHVTGEKVPHARIIWCCAWSQDGSVFSTGSRDGVVCVWDPHNGDLLCSVTVGESVTALAFSPIHNNAGPLLLVGTDSGQIIIHRWADHQLHRIHDFQSHGSTVRRIQFRPGKLLDFASCSTDSAVRIFRVVCPE